MAKEKWLIDPSELDEFQREIRELDISESYVITGCAGSGKTILALHRANDIRISLLADGGDPTDFTLVVRTKVLKGFIKSGIQDLGISLNQVVHYEKWDGDEVDYIVVDEVQDFNEDKINLCQTASRKSMMLYGDSEQQVYPDGMSTSDIAEKFELKEIKLSKNYRLPKSIATLAAHVGDDKLLENKCVKTGSQKPILKKFADWRSELDYIVGEIRTRNYTDVAILLPFNNKRKGNGMNWHRNVESVKEYLDSIGFSHEYKIRDDLNDLNELNFDSTLPKVMPFHSSKGLQFETVFIPFCDYPKHDPWFVSNYRRPFYVALTRSYQNLYITHTDRLTPFFDGIPQSKFA